MLGSRSEGRVCFSVDGRVQVVPATYAARQDRIFLRVVAFGSVARHVLTGPVTLQVDALLGVGRTSWAVTATGTARHVSDAATLASLWTPVRPASWESGQETLWVALTPDDVQGRGLRS